MGFIIFILLLAGGILAYIYLAEMEVEIRAEIAAAEGRSASERAAPAPRRIQEPGGPLAERICEQVRLAPQMLQADLYARLPGDDRKQVQKSVLELVRSGRLDRVRSGNSYQLTLVD